MRRITFSSVACLVYHIFATLSHKRNAFPKKEKGVFSFLLQILSETSLILRRIRRDILINVCWSSRKVTVLCAGLHVK
jgi:hypothetical protein